MTRLRTALSVAALLAVPAISAPAMAAVDASDPVRFIDTLSDEGFRALRSSNKTAARNQFRTLLTQHFAVDQIGDRLLGRWRTQITPAQRAAYKAAFPGFLIGTYADRLYDYANADVKVLRAVPAARGFAVMSQVVQKGAGRPINAIWTVEQPNGRLQVTNLSVAGINLAVTQAADFDAYIQRNGIDRLIAFMKSRG